MSLILDALRKMEQDRNSRRGSALDIRPEVLRYRAASRKRPRQLLPWAFGVVLLVGGIGAGFFLKSNHTTALSQDTAPPAPAAATVSVAPIAPVVAPVAPAGPAAPVAPMAPMLPALSEPASVPAQTVPLQAAPVAVKPPVRPAPLRLPAAAAPPVRTAEPVGRSRAKPVHREEVAAPQGAPADISITGIAWQDERSMRRAVINGSLVGEGAEIAGARVLEIREDRVRLSRGGQVFDAPFSSGFGR
jgi:general secretion pathway protein B